MSEYEAIYIASEYLNRTWAVLQFWAGVSFGLIALSHLGSRHLRLFMVCILTFLYVGFSLFVMIVMRLNGKVVDGFIADLEQMAAGGGSLSNGAVAVVDFAPGPLQMAVIIATYAGVFLGSLFFLWYSYWRSKKDAANSPDAAH